MAAKTIEAPVELISMIRKIEEAIKRRVAIGTKISYPKLHQEMMQRYENAKAIDHAIISMIKRDEFIHMEGRKILHRKKWVFDIVIGVINKLIINHSFIIHNIL